MLAIIHGNNHVQRPRTSDSDNDNDNEPAMTVQARKVCLRGATDGDSGFVTMKLKFQ